MARIENKLRKKNKVLHCCTSVYKWKNEAVVVRRREMDTKEAA